VRLAVGSSPHRILTRVLWEGVVIAIIGIAAGATGGLVLARVAAPFIGNVQLPGAYAVSGAAAVLIVAGVVASVIPAARASHVDVVQALRAE
jgi:ABC-type antimicrobial peptide transport system permease subunit